MKDKCFMCEKMTNDDYMFLTPKGNICLRCLKRDAGITSSHSISKITLHVNLDLDSENIIFKGESKIKINCTK